MARLAMAVFVTGVVLNLGGWIGNVLLLGPMWERAVAIAPPPLSSPFSPTVHAVLQFVSDFVFAFVLCLLYSLTRPGWRKSTFALAFICGILVWLGGVPMCYLGLVNGGYLPAQVSIATSTLALATFILTAPLLPVLLRVRSESPGRD